MVLRACVSATFAVVNRAGVLRCNFNGCRIITHHSAQAMGDDERPRMSEDAVLYRLYPTQQTSSSVATVLDEQSAAALRQQCMAVANEWIADHIWQCDPFELFVVASETTENQGLFNNDLTFAVILHETA